MVKYEPFCIYYQQKYHVTIFCKALEASILELIAQGKYEIDQKDSDPVMIVNIVSVDKEVCIEYEQGIQDIFQILLLLNKCVSHLI